MAKDPLIGRQLANFKIERLIGRGGMAKVYYGVDVKLERPVAIKVIDALYRDNRAYTRRFIREARTVATWRHENIIQIYYADDEDGLYYFVMEYIDGLDLGELLSQYAAKGELMPHDDVLRIGRAVASALDYAHEKGVIHRDVKPLNVLVAGDGRVVLADFGLAMDVHKGSRGKTFGSSLYIAPEQARRSADAVPQSDLYALGVMLYEMLTGTVPFNDPSPAIVALQHLNLPPPPPRQFNPNLSEETEAVLLKALSKSPEERYQTGSELIEALERTLEIGQPLSDRVELPTLPADIQTPVRSWPRILADEKVAQHLQASTKPAPPEDFTPPPDASLIGRQLDEYRLDALLGQGGMARVYRGVDVRTRRAVAIKVIDAPLRTDSDYMMRFEREAQAIAKLEHPHIVSLYRYGEADGLLYMAMKFIEGADLGSVLACHRQKLVESGEVSRIVREICLALDYAHSQGVIHRDVKPSNIMLDKQGHAILTDFGLALLTDLGTRGEVFGSPHHIAPEQAISSARVVPQSDLYAVGVILYEIFTGEFPFDADDPLDVAMLQMTEPPRPPRELCPDIRPELEAVILKVLAKEPEERYQSGAELAEALDQALQATSVEAPTSSPAIEQISVPATAPRPSPPVDVSGQPPAEHPLPLTLKRVPEEPPAEYPLPPIPAAAAASTSQQAEPSATPAPYLSIPERVPKEPLVKRPLPPIPAAVATPAPQQHDLPPVRDEAIGGAPGEPVKPPPPSQALTKPDFPRSPRALTRDRTAELKDYRADTIPSPSPKVSDRDRAMRWIMLDIILAGLVGMLVCGAGAFFFLPGDFNPLRQKTSTPKAQAAVTPMPTHTLPAPMPFLTVAPPIATSTPAAEPMETTLPLPPTVPPATPTVAPTATPTPTSTTTPTVTPTATPKTTSTATLTVTPTATPTTTPTPPATPTGTATPTRTPTFTKTSTATATPTRTLTPTTGPPTPTGPASYVLLIAKHGEDSLFVVNQTTVAFPLAPLRLGDGRGAINGTDWGIDMLENGACVTAWKDKRKPRPPDGLTCNQVGESLTRGGRDLFWREAFDVYYSNEDIDTCEKNQEQCYISIPIQWD